MRNLSSHSELVGAVLSDVSDPRECLVSTALNNFEVTHLKQRR